MFAMRSRHRTPLLFSFWSRLGRGALSVLVAVLWAAPSSAGVERLEISVREAAFGGRSFDGVGAYERIEGVLHFAYDPKLPSSELVTDLSLAPRDEDGLVRAQANVRVLRPLEGGDDGTALLEVSNRGRMASLRYFNRATSSDLGDPQAAGDGFLMRQGLTVVWVGWQVDVPDTPERSPALLRLSAPRVTRPAGNAPLVGLVRADWTVDQTTERLELGHRGHVPYPVQDPNDAANVLTYRAGRKSPRRKVMRSEWSFDGDAITSAKGFEAGRIYELVYRSQDPTLVGLGLAAVRDTIAFVKHDERCPFRAEHGLAFGVSQTGRFLRHFLFDGFNADEEGRRAFDGMLIHSAGAGRGSFNHRFAQPSRDAHRYSAFFYPTDLFPFSGRRQRDPIQHRTDGLLARVAPEHLPRIMYTNTGYEYWGRAASLLHTSLFATSDVPPLANERIYHLASGQHFVSPMPRPGQATLYPLDSASARGFRGNPLDFLWTERALLAALERWVVDDVEPPPSAYPRIDDGTLVAPLELDFPALRGVARPERAHDAYRLDFGERWESKRQIENQPPKLGAPFASLVPQVDRFGNELGGVPSIETLAPLATYTPWSIREGMAGGNGELIDFFGNVFPLPRNAQEKRAVADPRPSIEELYGAPDVAKDAWFEQAQAAARALVERGYLLAEDVPAVLRAAELTWAWLMDLPEIEVQYR